MLTADVMAALRQSFAKLATEEPGEEPAKKKPEHPLMTMAKSVGAYGLGTGVGAGGLMLADAISNKYRGAPLVTPGFARSAAPHVMGAGAVLAHMAQQGMFDRFRRHDEASQ